MRNDERRPGRPDVQPCKEKCQCDIRVAHHGRMTEFYRCKSKAKWTIDGDIHVCGLHKRKAEEGCLWNIIVGKNDGPSRRSFDTKQVTWEGARKEKADEEEVNRRREWKTKIESIHDVAFQKLALLYGLTDLELKALLGERPQYEILKTSGDYSIKVRVGKVEGSLFR